MWAAEAWDQTEEPRPWRRGSIRLERFWILSGKWRRDALAWVPTEKPEWEYKHQDYCCETSDSNECLDSRKAVLFCMSRTYTENTAEADFWSLLFSTSRSHTSIVTWSRGLRTHWWHSLTRSRSVVAGGRPRMYRLVLLSCSGPVLLLLLLLLGLDGVMG